METLQTTIAIVSLCAWPLFAGCSDDDAVGAISTDSSSDAVVDTSAGGGDTSAGGGDTGGAAPPRRVLLLIADDLGVDQVLVYADADGDGKADDGRSYPTMPTLNGICSAGVRFDNAWATPTCSPTRATMLTGRYGFRTGVGWAIAKKNQLQLSEVTLPELLSAKGVATANIGKWHLGAGKSIGGDEAPNKAGWQYYAGVLGGTLDDYYQWPRTVNGKTDDSTTYATTANVDDAITWLEDRGQAEPWLLWMAFNAPHAPFHKPPNALHDSDHLKGSTGHAKKNPGLYYPAMLQALDTEVARLLKWLGDNGQAPTDIIFIGDNGSPGQVATSPWDETKSKGTLYEGGVRVPYCVSGQAVSGKTSSAALVHTVDLFATICGLFGVSIGNAGEDSDDLAPVLKDAKASWRDFNYTESFGNPQGSSDEQGKAITDGTYKLIRFESGAELLFDLSTDRQENKDLKAAGPSGAAKTAYDALSKKLDEVK